MISKQANADLTHLNTLGLPARARWLVQADEPDALPEVFGFAASMGLPVFPLGGGSNLILTGELPAVVLQQRPLPLVWPDAGGDSCVLKAPAGINWHQLVLETTAQGWFGLENLALIPGQAGAAPVQNIGAYGVEVCDSLAGVEGWWLPEQGRPARFDQLAAADCAFGYRDSRFKQDWKGRFVITALHLMLRRDAEPRLDYADLAQRLAVYRLTQPAAVPLPRLIAETVAAIRGEKLPDPAVIGNVGSFFKNPVISREQAAQLQAEWPDLPTYPVAEGVKLAAGWLIDQCGFKGYRQGAVGVHDRQALVLVHAGGGTAEQLLALADAITASVKSRFGVQLEREPEVVGS